MKGRQPVYRAVCFDLDGVLIERCYPERTARTVVDRVVGVTYNRSSSDPRGDR